MNNDSFINYGVGAWPKPAVHLPATLYNPKQQVAIMAKHAQIDHEIKTRSSAVSSKPKKWGRFTGDKYFMPNDWVGVL